LAFVKATKIYQDIVSLKSPFLVGFFLAGWATFGGLQESWTVKALKTLKNFQIFVGSTLLITFNDNTAIIYLSSLVSEYAMNPSREKSVVSRLSWDQDSWYRLVHKYMHQPPRWVMEFAFQVGVSLECGPFRKLNISNRIRLCGF
jgi:hypothetical protein